MRQADHFEVGVAALRHSWGSNSLHHTPESSASILLGYRPSYVAELAQAIRDLKPGKRGGPGKLRFDAGYCVVWVEATKNPNAPGIWYDGRMRYRASRKEQTHDPQWPLKQPRLRDLMIPIKEKPHG